VTLLPDVAFLQPVEGHEDLFRFAVPMEQKALDNQEAVTVEENGDLVIEGYAAVWEGEDRQGENFAPGAFERASKAFVEGQGALCFHHKHDHVLGRVEHLQEDGKGLKMRARVDGAIANHPVLGTIYNQIKKGTLRGLSVGGFFKRAIIEGKQRIADMDFTEISVTGVPVHTGPSFAVVAGKALASEIKVPDNVPDPNIPEDEIREEDFYQIQYALESLSRVFERLEKRGDKTADNPTEDAVAVL
jgi:hypothetical protein